MADSLFEIDAPESTVPLQHLPITDEQVAQIRAAFADISVHEQHQRKALIESYMVRKVNSLRDLHATDAHRLLNLLRQRKVTQPKIVGGSAWDNREEETWIDKL